MRIYPMIKQNFKTAYLRSIVPAILASLWGGLFTACATQSAALPLVRSYAERDLDCPSDQIRIEEQWGGKMKALGCGRKATYQTACTGLQCEVRNENEPAIPMPDRPTQP